MKRFFISLYLSFAAALFIFIVAGHFLSTEVMTDVESVIASKNITAEIELLEELQPHLNEQQLQQRLDRIADLNQLIIKQIPVAELPHTIQLGLEKQRLDFIVDEVSYLKAFTPSRYYILDVNQRHPLFIMEDKVFYAVLFCLFVIMAVSCLLWLLGLRRKLLPIELALEKISRGDLSARAPVTHGMKVGNINDRVNQLALRIEQLLNSHKKLTHTIAHEFRSPLFRMQMQLELLQEQPAEHKDKYTNGIEEDIFFLQELIDELLQYAQLEQACYQLKKKTVKIAPMLKKVADRLGRNSHKCIELSFCPSPQQEIKADAKLLERCIANLLSNALKYANEQVNIKLLQDENSLSIIVEDDGPGIDESEWEKVFEPFYRNQQQRQQGYGLGLAIAKEIAELHQGRLTLTASALGGAGFTLKFDTTFSSSVNFNS